MKHSRTKPGRANQQLRTRKDLLGAAARLLQQGRTPTMDEVAEEALVSRATAYRYFPTLESLLVEAPLDGATPDPETLFAADTSTDPAERVDRAEAALHEMVYQNETQLRLLLAHSLDPRTRGDAPPRQNRRNALIEAALAPARDRFDDATYRRLCRALALVFGPEAMVVFRDVVPTSPRNAREIKRWMVRTLVHAALAESRRKGRRQQAGEHGEGRGT